MKHLMTGNEAAARGAYEAGLVVGAAYPGTPSTEIFENLPLYRDDLYCEWSPNEKVATEVAYGASIAGVRSLCAMKHVGVNVAADPIFTATYNGIGAGFVIVSADDPDMHSSQNEQDNRYYARAAKMPMVEPSDSQECKDFMKAAYEISEKFDLPVLYRVTTRVCHSKSLVEFGERTEVAPLEYKRNMKYICTPAQAKLNHPKLEKKLAELAEYGNTCPLNKMELNGSKVGVITASIAYQYAKEAFPEDTSFLKLGLTNPLPMGLIKEFASKVEKLYIVEELEPFMEEQIKAAGIQCVGKELISNMYELNPEKVRTMVFGSEPEYKTLPVKAVSRPASLCPGCPHRGFFYTMSKGKDFVICGDIGCYTLGCAHPLNALDSVVCMGGGFSVAMGMAKAFEVTKQTGKKVFGVVGDSTFFHSGITGAIDMIYNMGNVIPCVLDNSITGMTGQQDNPGSGETLMGKPAPVVRPENILRACGFENIIIVDPQDLKAMQKAVDDALASEVPAAIITRRPCLLLKKAKHDIGKCEVNKDKCRSCKMCLKVGCSAIFFKDGKAHIDQTLCVGCNVCGQACPFGAIERK
ncbi:MAG: indolepyruvate ferredoxin oxidoreductase subunit alpha [Clostridia bacterium]|nr:indolepyruvate ferredoxin oxidoreductase subunit alpha [Clostridia bacterium]MBR4018569.1 indolepyruvate ferredoxin oxidoreductase subunit alpha [Clostridia bacterium]